MCNKTELCLCITNNRTITFDYMVLNMSNKNEQDSALQKIKPETPDFVVRSQLSSHDKKHTPLKLSLKTLISRFRSLTSMSICRAYPCFHFQCWNSRQHKTIKYGDFYLQKNVKDGVSSAFSEHTTIKHDHLIHKKCQSLDFYCVID